MYRVSFILSLIIIFLAALAIVQAHSEKNTDKKSQINIKASDVYEKCIKIEPSQTLHYSFRSSKPLKFNLHYHLLDRTVFHINEETAGREEIFHPVKDQKVYCMELRNTNPETVNLDYGYTISHR
jgi:hypothetical protein